MGCCLQCHFASCRRRCWDHCRWRRHCRYNSSCCSHRFQFRLVLALVTRLPVRLSLTLPLSVTVGFAAVVVAVVVVAAIGAGAAVFVGVVASAAAPPCSRQSPPRSLLSSRALLVPMLPAIFSSWAALALVLLLSRSWSVSPSRSSARSLAPWRLNCGAIANAMLRKYAVHEWLHIAFNSFKT